MARKGLRALNGDEQLYEARLPATADRRGEAESRNAQRWEPDEVWVIDPDQDTGGGGVGPGGSKRNEAGGRRAGVSARRAGDVAGHRRNVPAPVVDELASAAGDQRGSKLAARLADATHAFDKERFEEAKRLLRPLAVEVPDASAVQELYGLALYRLGQWAFAARHLELYRNLTGSSDQHPVLADCYRALKRYGAAEELWEELRQASPGGDLVAEGRIVAAGCRADRGDLAGAIALLERTSKRVHRPQDRHIRQWYALADLYERAGDIPRARELFSRIDAVDPEVFDVRQRLRALR